MEYRGIQWKDKRNLSKKLHKCESYVSGCLNQGKTYEEIIDYVLDKRITKYLSEEVILKLNTKGGF